MTDRPPITVPLDLIEDWRLAPEFCDGKKKIVMVTVSRERMQYIADQAAQWGADMELEACCEWIDQNTGRWDLLAELRTARRPKPQTLNSIALQMLGTIERDGRYLPEITDTIRRALEQLDD
jgi:hypothetical protein